MSGGKCLAAASSKKGTTQPAQTPPAPSFSYIGDKNTKPAPKRRVAL